MKISPNNLQISKIYLSNCQIHLPSSNNNSSHHQLKGQIKDSGKGYKQNRSISMSHEYQNRHETGITSRSRSILNKFDQLTHQEMLKKKARQFIIKIKKQKESYYGKQILDRQNQENRKLMRNKQAEDKQCYRKSIRQERRRVLQRKRRQQLQSQNESMGNMQSIPRQQQYFSKSPQAINQSENIHKQIAHKNKRLQTILEDKNKSHKFVSIDRLNSHRKERTQPSKLTLPHQSHLPFVKTYQPSRVSSSSNHYNCSPRVKLPQPNLLTAEDIKQLEEIKNKMAILIKLNSKR